MNHITEIIPDDLPEWANEAMADGQLFRVCIEKATSKDDLLEMAWVIIANAHQGFWENAPDAWQKAAAKWRDDYHAAVVDRQDSE
jgi:hypothetical protein